MNLDVRLQLWGYARTDHAVVRSNHAHSYWQVNLIDGGRMECAAAGETRQVEAGDILIFPPQCHHQFIYLANGGLSQLSLKFRLDSPPPELNCEFRHLRADAETAAIFDQLRCAICGFLLPGEWQYTERELMIPTDRRKAMFPERILAAMLEYYLGADGGESAGLIARVRHYLAGRRGKPVKVEQMARHFGYSPGHFSQLIRKLTGQPAKHFIDRERAALACHLLEYSDLNVAELSRQLGFGESVYFCEFFKRQTGESPGRYRRRLRGENLPDTLSFPEKRATLEPAPVAEPDKNL